MEFISWYNGDLCTPGLAWPHKGYGLEMTHVEPQISSIFISEWEPLVLPRENSIIASILKFTLKSLV